MSRAFLLLTLAAGCADTPGAVVCDDGSAPGQVFRDADGDGFGREDRARYACDLSLGFSSEIGDCNDEDATIFPGAVESCGGVDDDCDGTADEDATLALLTWYGDADGDGHGVSTEPVEACLQPVGYAPVDDDCEDGDATVHPDADELCDGADQDCDGEIDEEGVDGQTYHPDLDGDGYGASGVSHSACDGGAWVLDNTDCDDADAETYPAAPERCDGLDHDCDGSIMEGGSIDAVAWYRDDDLDGFGDAASLVGMACPGVPPAGLAADACDCDDTAAAYNPDGLDCDSVACPAGGEVWLDDSCGLREVTADISGSAGMPATLEVVEDTTVWFCAGTHYVQVRSTTAVVSLVGVDGADSVTLDAEGAAGIVYAGSLSIEGLTLSGGLSGSVGGAAIYGVGDVALVDSVVTASSGTSAYSTILDIDGTLSMTGSRIYDNEVAATNTTSTSATMSVVVVTGNLVMVDSSVSENSLSCESWGSFATLNEQLGATVRVGGGLAMDGSAIHDNLLYGYSDGGGSSNHGAAGAWVDGDVTLVGSALSGNASEAALDCNWTDCARQAAGGGLHVGGDLLMTDSVVSGNSALYLGSNTSGADVTLLLGGGIYLDGGSLLCTSTDGGDHGIYGNSSDSGGGVYWAAPTATATITSDGCDWTGDADNDPDDIAGAASWSGGDESRVVCDAMGTCVE